MANKRISDDKVAAVVAAIRAGHPRNKVAADTGVGAGSVTKIAADHGLSFDREATRAATEAKKADAAALRAQLELDYLADAQRLRRRAFATMTYRQPMSRGELGHDIAEWTTDEPTAPDQLKLMQASTLAAGASQKIADAATDAGVEQVSSMLGNLFSMLGQQFRTMQAADQADNLSQEE